MRVGVGWLNTPAPEGDDSTSSPSCSRCNGSWPEAPGRRPRPAVTDDSVRISKELARRGFIEGIER